MRGCAGQGLVSIEGWRLYDQPLREYIVIAESGKAKFH